MKNTCNSAQGEQEGYVRGILYSCKALSSYSAALTPGIFILSINNLASPPPLLFLNIISAFFVCDELLVFLFKYCCQAQAYLLLMCFFGLFCQKEKADVTCLIQAKIYKCLSHEMSFFLAYMLDFNME